MARPFLQSLYILSHNLGNLMLALETMRRDVHTACASLFSWRGCQVFCTLEDGRVGTAEGQRSGGAGIVLLVVGDSLVLG